MKDKIFSGLLLLAMIVMMGFISIGEASAQTSPFPPGCASALGYSATTGNPCNGTSTATSRPMPGCTSALGYSATTGKPCSGGDVALNFLVGCTSVNGYSSITGEPCNGTSVATNGFVALSPTYVGGSTNTPGLPTTGAGGEAPMNVLMMALSLGVVVLGSTYLVTKERP
jgi:hypothetical protein